jgi:pimeloyl-ACP methyl ester carboxylesterase
MVPCGRHSVAMMKTLRRLAILATAFSALAALPAAASAKPTVVLVHGAFADASGWYGVQERLEDKGYKVISPAHPLRGVSADAAYLKSYLTTIKGPIVLVGHSYGGVVITNAATGNANVKALVYIAAYAPDQGDTVQSLSALGKEGQIGPATLDITPFPNPDGTTGQEGAIKLDVFHKIFAADLSKKLARNMAVAQRPASLVALGEPSGVPAWKTIPSYYMIAGADKAIGADAEVAMAKRIKPKKTITVKGASHVVMISQPKNTAEFILEAATGLK